jgi:hypothetical protein
VENDEVWENTLVGLSRLRVSPAGGVEVVHVWGETVCVYFVSDLDVDHSFLVEQDVPFFDSCFLVCPWFISRPRASHYLTFTS